jgi:hypothetical protein
MAKFSQNTLNQVGGFDGQVLAQELVYNQKDYWNIVWSYITSYPSGWQTGTTPIDLTGATIDVQIIRRAITNFRDSRGGYDFTIRDYPLVSLVTTVTATSTSTNILTCSDTSELYVGMPIQFKGSVFGGVAINTTYYVKDILTSTAFTISATRGAAPTYTPGTIFALSTTTGTMTVNRIEPDIIDLSANVTNRDDAAGSFTLEIDDETWELIGRSDSQITYSGLPGDPDLGINATDPACFTGRIKISFPASGTTPAHDESIFLLFLVASDGVYN